MKFSYSCKTNVYDWGLNEYSSGEYCQKLNKSLSKNFSYLVISIVCVIVVFFIILVIIMAKRSKIASKYQENVPIKNTNDYYYVDQNKINKDEHDYQDITEP